MKGEGGEGAKADTGSRRRGGGEQGHRDRTGPRPRSSLAWRARPAGTAPRGCAAQRPRPPSGQAGPPPSPPPQLQSWPLATGLGKTSDIWVRPPTSSWAQRERPALTPRPPPHPIPPSRSHRAEARAEWRQHPPACPGRRPASLAPSTSAPEATAGQELAGLLRETTRETTARQAAAIGRARGPGGARRPETRATRGGSALSRAGGSARPWGGGGGPAAGHHNVSLRPRRNHNSPAGPAARGGRPGGRVRAPHRPHGDHTPR